MWNQSMVVQLTRAGNCLARTRKRSPTGLKHSTTCRYVLTCTTPPAETRGLGQAMAEPWLVCSAHDAACACCVSLGPLQTSMLDSKTASLMALAKTMNMAP